MAEEPMIGQYRFDGESLETMYRWMHEQGYGPSSAETARAALTNLGALLINVEEDIRKALSEIGVEWEGAAAAAAGQAIQEAANWVTASGEMSIEASRPAAEQGEAFIAARAQIQKPQSAGYGFGDAMADGFNAVADIGTFGMNPFEIQTDVDHAAQQNAANHAAAVKAMSTWNSKAVTNLAAMPRIEAAPPIALVDASSTPLPQPPLDDSGITGPDGDPAQPGAASGAHGVQGPVALQHVAPAPTAAGIAGPGGAPTPSGPIGSPSASPSILAGAPIGGQGSRSGGQPLRARFGGTGLDSRAAAGGAPGYAGPGTPRSGHPTGGPGRGGPGSGGVARAADGSARLGITGSPAAGPPAGGPAAPGAPASGSAASGSAASAAAGRGGGSGSFLHPAATGAGSSRGLAGDEHEDRYWQKDSELFEDHRLVAPPVIGEDPSR